MTVTVISSLCAFKLSSIQCLIFFPLSALQYDLEVTDQKQLVLNVSPLNKETKYSYFCDIYFQL
jgi:hypothetical protein